MFYQEKLVDQYLESLQKEILEIYQEETIETLYIGGGTPSSLNIEQLAKLLEITNIFKKEKLKEFTIEMNSEDITEEKLLLFKKYNINRISIGHQTKHPKYLKELERSSYISKEQIELVKKYFDNINVDLMYGFYKQTKKEFIEDLTYILELEVPHISTYSLILEEHTKLFIQKYQRLGEDQDAKFYQLIQKTLNNHGLQQYEISNFSKPGYESKHNIAYWNNQQYYGFGLGASGYIQNIRYTNTRSMNQYLKGNRILDQEVLNKEDIMIYEMILGLRKVEGVSKKKFLSKFGCNIEQTFDIIDIMNQDLLKIQGDYLYIPKEYLYRENQILIHFLEVKSEK